MPWPSRRPTPRPTPRPVLVLWFISEYVAAVEEVELDNEVIAMIEDVGDVLVMTVEAENDDDGEAVALEVGRKFSDFEMGTAQCGSCITRII